MSNNNNNNDDQQPPNRSALTDACIDIWLLSRKNFKIQFRHRLATFLELIVPCLLVLMIAIIRTKVSVTEFDQPTIYDEFDLLQIPKILEQHPEFQIYFTPNTSQTNQIMENLLENLQQKCQLNRLYELKLPCLPSITGFENSNKMIDQYLLDDKFVLCGIEFEQLTNDNIKFSLRFSNIPRTLKQSAMKIEDWKTQMIMMNVMPAGPRDKNNTNGGQPGYEDEGFLFIQHLLSMAIGKTLFANDSNFDLFNLMEIELMGQRFPYPKYIRHPRFQVSIISRFFPGATKLNTIQLTMEYCTILGFVVMIVLLIKGLFPKIYLKTKKFILFLKNYYFFCSFFFFFFSK